MVSVNRDLCTIQYDETKMQCYKKRLLELIKETTGVTGGEHENLD